MFGRTNKEVVFRGEFDPDLWAVEVDQGQIEQVIMNLYLNAVQAMSGGGTLTVKTENIRIVAARQRARPNRSARGPHMKESPHPTKNSANRIEPAKAMSAGPLASPDFGKSSFRAGLSTRA